MGVITNRTFVLRSSDAETSAYPAAYYAGTLADGTLALASHRFEELQIVKFDSFGRFTGAESFLNPRSEESLARPYYPDTVLEFIHQWQARVGFCSGTITIRHFAIDQPFSVGIRLLHTGGHLEVLRNPYGFPSQEERLDMMSVVVEWITQRNFVLYWGEEEFGLTQDGRSAF